MKKTYQNPTLEVVQIQTVGMLASSLPKGTNGVTDERSVLSRDIDLADDEWEED